MHYLIQCEHYMAVTGRKAWYIAVVILGQGFQFAKIEQDDAMIANLIAIEEAFWNSYVVPRIIPPPDGSKVCNEVLEQYFHNARKVETAIQEAVKIPPGEDERPARREGHSA